MIYIYFTQVNYYMVIFTQEKEKKKFIFVINLEHVHKVYNACISEVAQLPITRIVYLT